MRSNDRPSRGEVAEGRHHADRLAPARVEIGRHREVPGVREPVDLAPYVVAHAHRVEDDDHARPRAGAHRSRQVAVEGAARRDLHVGHQFEPRYLPRSRRRARRRPLAGSDELAVVCRAGQAQVMPVLVTVVVPTEAAEVPHGGRPTGFDGLVVVDLEVLGDVTAHNGALRKELLDSNLPLVGRTMCVQQKNAIVFQSWGCSTRARAPGGLRTKTSLASRRPRRWLSASVHGIRGGAGRDR